MRRLAVLGSLALAIGVASPALASGWPLANGAVGYVDVGGLQPDLKVAWGDGAIIQQGGVGILRMTVSLTDAKNAAIGQNQGSCAALGSEIAKNVRKMFAMEVPLINTAKLKPVAVPADYVAQRSKVRAGVDLAMLEGAPSANMKCLAVSVSGKPVMLEVIAAYRL